MESTWVGDWIGTFIEMDQCSMFEELTKTCAKHQNSHGSPISCQLNRLKGLRMQMNQLNCLKIEMNRTKPWKNEDEPNIFSKEEDEPNKNAKEA